MYTAQTQKVGQCHLAGRTSIHPQNMPHMQMSPTVPESEWWDVSHSTLTRPSHDISPAERVGKSSWEEQHRFVLRGIGSVLTKQHKHTVRMVASRAERLSNMTWIWQHFQMCAWGQRKRTALPPPPPQLLLFWVISTIKPGWVSHRVPVNSGKKRNWKEGRQVTALPIVLRSSDSCGAAWPPSTLTEVLLPDATNSNTLNWPLRLDWFFASNFYFYTPTNTNWCTCQNSLILVYI